MPVSPVIEVARLNAPYGDFHPVEELSFQVARPETYALRGANGVGKTSTLEVIEGRWMTLAGTVRVSGKISADRRAVRSRAGTRLQRSGFAADLTVAGASGNDRQQSRAGV
ncbi:ATP-binding cassette domain-containing protein [Micromonospora sp. NPDC049374]|uniref:ATP-binding cassette domain-containing protein n=1 Tax=Micromonospora sp. NPDC049374 TaxID=3154352 RepID=UPI0034274D79